MEVVEDFNGETYRGIYTIKFEGIVYVLHTFQKKSKHGIETPGQPHTFLNKEGHISQQ
jgi:phage-related protein